jgi:hypothetical protein
MFPGKITKDRNRIVAPGSGRRLAFLWNQPRHSKPLFRFVDEVTLHIGVGKMITPRQTARGKGDDQQPRV